MARRRFFIDEVRHGRAELHGEEAKHLTRVLRVEKGQRFELSDNRRAWLGEVTEAHRDKVCFAIVEELPSSPVPLVLTLCPALIKFDRLEWILEKGTELGVACFLPVVAERSDRGLEKAAAGRMKRWRRILLESSQQSRRDRLPELRPPVSFTAALTLAAKLRFFLDEHKAAPALLAVMPPPAARRPQDEVALLVGPEGGWTEAEHDEATAAAWTPVSLGGQVLRAETAAMAAVAILATAWSATAG